MKPFRLSPLDKVLRGLPWLGLLLLLVFGVYRNLDDSPKILQQGNQQGNKTIEDFQQAKEIAATLYRDHPVTFYCQCPFSGKKIDLTSCPFPVEPSERAKRVEWEHIVPAAKFGHKFAAWKTGNPACLGKNGKRYKGRKCAQKVSTEFRFMEADLYNLVPAVGSVNQARGSLAMAETTHHPQRLCKLELGKKTAIPDEDLRGVIARAYLYMDQAYPEVKLLSAAEKRVYESWHEQHAPSELEKKHAQRIAQIQGNTNPYLTENALKEQLSYSARDSEKAGL